MTFADILLIIVIVAGLILAGLYFLNRWAAKKYSGQQNMIDKTKTVTNIFVLDKKKMRLKNANFPKVIYDGIPKFYRVFKMPMIQAKIGNKIMNLICDKKVFKSISVKKNCKVELAGIYILGFAGSKNNNTKKQK